MLHKVMKTVAPVAGLALGAMLAGCSVDMGTGGMDGVTLAELDVSAEAPTGVALVGPDNISVSRGDRFDVDVTGDADAVDAVRFELDGDTLKVGRMKNAGRDLGKAQVLVVLPSLRTIALAGSGDVVSDHFDGDGEVSIAGSGTARLGQIATQKLEVAIAGSGSVEGEGSTDTLEVSVAGSGSTRLAGLKAGNADVSIAGSGDVAFASDGKVDASIMGSGDVAVTGNATCTVSAMGSGKLRCSSGS